MSRCEMFWPIVIILSILCGMVGGNISLTVSILRILERMAER